MQKVIATESQPSAIVDLERQEWVRGMRSPTMISMYKFVSRAKSALNRKNPHRGENRGRKATPKPNPLVFPFPSTALLSSPLRQSQAQELVASCRGLARSCFPKEDEFVRVLAYLRGR